jgi:hypothetical protein
MDSESITSFTSELGINNTIEVTPDAPSESGSFNEAIFNSPYYKLEPDSESKHYIFKEGLFTPKLVSYDERFEREVICQCTM